MKTIREETVGGATIRILKTSDGFAGIVIRDGKRSEPMHGENDQKLWAALVNHVGTTHPNYFGWDGAISRFKKLFPDGFHSQRYEEMERNYKLAAKQKLEDTLPLASDFSNSDAGIAALRIFQATNLIDRFAKTKLSEMLHSENAQGFLKSAATFANGDIANGLAGMHAATSSHDASKWTIITYLPYLWRPEQHMFLKPTVTKDFAERVGHSFSFEYETTLNASVYESLLSLVNVTRKKLADLGPRDNIDIQSFIWIVGAYTDDDLPENAKHE